MKKILVSLIEAAQKILCLNPEAADLFKEAEGINLLLPSATNCKGYVFTGVCLPTGGGGSAPDGAWSGGPGLGGCLIRGGWSGWVPGPWGVPGPGGGAWSWGGWYPSIH